MTGRPPTNKIPAELRARIAARVRVASVTDVAWEFRVSVTTVRNIRDEFGIPARPLGPPMIWGKALVRRNVMSLHLGLKPRGQRPLWWTSEKEEAAA